MRRASYFRECQLVFRCYVTQRAKLIKATGNFQESLWNRGRGAAFFLHKDYKRIPPDDNRKSFSQFRIGRSPFPVCLCHALVLPFRADDRSASHRIDLSIRAPLIHSGTQVESACLGWKIRVISREIIVRNGGVSLHRSINRQRFIWIVVPYSNCVHV